MGGFLRVVDVILFFFFIFMAVKSLLIDAQICIPQHIFPDFLIDLKSWYNRDYGDYLVVEKPDFFVGIAWLQLLFQLPLSIANLYAIIANKSWFHTTCLIHGVSAFTAMIAVLTELIRSRKATDKLLMVYFPSFGLAVMALLRGLTPNSNSNSATKAAKGRKKRA